MGPKIIRVFGALEADPTLYRCVILTGAGNRAFCGGADLKQREGMTDEQFGVQHYLFERMNRAITYCPVPIICAANGSAVAGGLELLLACDFAYAAKSAVFGFTEVRRGIMPGGGTQQLPRTFSAEKALAWGVRQSAMRAGTRALGCHRRRARYLHECPAIGRAGEEGDRPQHAGRFAHGILSGNRSV